MLDKNEAVPDYSSRRQMPQRLADLHKLLRGALVDAGLAK